MLWTSWTWLWSLIAVIDPLFGDRPAFFFVEASASRIHSRTFLRVSLQSQSQMVWRRWMSVCAYPVHVSECPPVLKQVDVRDDQCMSMWVYLVRVSCAYSLKIRTVSWIRQNTYVSGYENVSSQLCILIVFKKSCIHMVSTPYRRNDDTTHVSRRIL